MEKFYKGFQHLVLDLRRFLLTSNRFLDAVISLAMSLVVRLTFRSTALGLMLVLVIMSPVMFYDYMSDLQLTLLFFRSVGLLLFVVVLIVFTAIIGGLDRLIARIRKR